MRGDHTFEMQSEHKRDLITVMFPFFFVQENVGQNFIKD